MRGQGSEVNFTCQEVGSPSVGARLRAQREALGLSQAAIAERCGVSRRAVINFEQDTNQPGGAFLIAAAGLGVDVAFVLTGRPSASSEDEAALLNAFRGLADRDRAALIQTVKKTRR